MYHKFLYLTSNIRIFDVLKVYANWSNLFDNFSSECNKSHNKWHNQINPALNLWIFMESFKREEFVLLYHAPKSGWQCFRSGK